MTSWRDVFVSSEENPAALYPTGIILTLSFFICATVVSELGHGVAARRRNTGENILKAFAVFSWRSRRRYGGYVVHVGVAALAAGIVISSMFKVEEQLVLKLGESARVGPYLITPISETVREEPAPGEPYAKVQVLFRVTRPRESPVPVAHGEAARPAGEPQGSVVAELRPERRFYPKKRQWINEVTIHRRPLEDIYIYFSGRDAQGNIGFVVFLNPFMMLIYVGWLTMVGGAVFAALPSRSGRRTARA